MFFDTLHKNQKWVHVFETLVSKDAFLDADSLFERVEDGNHSFSILVKDIIVP